MAAPSAMTGYPRRYAIVLLWVGVASYVSARLVALMAGLLGWLD